VVVGGDRREAAVARRVHGRLDPGEGLALVPELDQRQVSAQVHPATIACRARRIYG
jgi:hypothetical protein